MLQELLARRADLIAEANLIFDRAKGRKLTAAEAERDDAIEDELREIGLRRRHAERSAGGFESLGEFARAVCKAAHPHHSRIDPRLMAGPAGLSETMASDGGFLVPTAMAGDLVTKLYTQGELNARCTHLTSAGLENEIRAPILDEKSRGNGSRWGGLTLRRVAEGEPIPAVKPELREIKLPLTKLAGVVYATSSLIKDAPLLGAVLEFAFLEEANFQTELGLIHGVGGDQMIGTLNADAAITIEAEGDQGAGTIVPANLEKMWAAFPIAARKSGCWITSKSGEIALGRCVTTIKNVAGTETVGAVLTPTITWLPPGSVAGSPWAHLNGLPVIPHEVAPIAGVRGDLQLVDLSQYVIVDKAAVLTPSLHLRFLYDEEVFRFTYRMNGQPIWSAPRKAYGTEDPESPFVILGSRA